MNARKLVFSHFEGLFGQTHIQIGPCFRHIFRGWRNITMVDSSHHYCDISIVQRRISQNIEGSILTNFPYIQENMSQSWYSIDFPLKNCFFDTPKAYHFAAVDLSILKVKFWELCLVKNKYGDFGVDQTIDYAVLRGLKYFSNTFTVSLISYPLFHMH